MLVGCKTVARAPQPFRRVKLGVCLFCNIIFSPNRLLPTNSLLQTAPSQIPISSVGCQTNRFPHGVENPTSWLPRANWVVQIDNRHSCYQNSVETRRASGHSGDKRYEVRGSFASFVSVGQSKDNSKYSMILANKMSGILQR